MRRSVEDPNISFLPRHRTGTHGLYLALKQLGFKPYHMAEVLKRGPPSVQIMNDGLAADMFHQGKPYGRAEFDKWFADYDVSIPVTSTYVNSSRAYTTAGNRS